ncbi:MAG TPA: hypothetical protein VNL70_03085, partial [Tepidisphaeraceae bacterium]|nr:hypothetical protein [Tepidisphaeraceae bacterium]
GLVRRAAGCECLEQMLQLAAAVVMNLKLDDDQAPHRLQITWDQSVTMNASLLHVYNQNTDLIEPVQYDGAFWLFN